MDRQHKILFGLLALAFIAFILASYTSPEDVKKCVDATGWSAERCQVELSR